MSSFVEQPGKSCVRGVIVTSWSLLSAFTAKTSSLPAVKLETSYDSAGYSVRRAGMTCRRLRSNRRR